MQKIIYIQDYNSKKKGDIEIVSNNVAFGLIERGVAMIYGQYQTEAFSEPPEDRMMRTTRKGKKYRIK